MRTAVPPETVEVVWVRDKGRCARCGRRLVREQRVWGWSLSHRLPRGMGGSRAAFINEPGNLNLLCGSGTTGCHGHIERNRAEAYDAGFLVRSGIRLPADTPIDHFLYGRVLLNDDGTVTPAKETEP